MRLWIWDLIWGCLFCLNVIASVVSFFTRLNLPAVILSFFSLGLALYCFICFINDIIKYKDITIGNYIKNKMEKVKELDYVGPHNYEMNLIFGIFCVPIFYLIFTVLTLMWLLIFR